MLVNIATFFIECVKLLFVLCGILNYKVKKSVSAAVVLFVCVGVLVVKGVMDADYRVSTFYFLVTIICALVVEGRRKFLFSLVAYLGICSLDEIIRLLVRTWFAVSNQEIGDNPILYSITNSVSLVMLGLVVCLLQKTYYKRNRKIKWGVQNSNCFYLLLFLTGQLGALICMIPVTSVAFKWNMKTEYLIMIGVCVFSVLVLLLGILLIYNSNAKQHYRRMAEVNHKFIESQERYYEMLLEKESETRMFRHDIKNHIMCIDALLEDGEYKEVEQYLHELKSAVAELKIKQQTGNRLVNVIVSDIAARYSHVDLLWDGELPAKMKISNTDICVIFSNILENAFLAASECEEKQGVEVKIKGAANGLVVSVCNDMNRSVTERNGRFITNKTDDRNHGIGTLNVKKSVISNGGEVEYNYTDTKFMVEIVLPNVI